MSRVFTLLLAFALLFQMSWAVAATYCEHEAPSGGAVQHFGHHVHVHQSGDARKQVTSQLAVDDDCGFCHAAQPGLLPVMLGLAVGGTPAAAPRHHPSVHPSALARAPDRPQWNRLA